MSAQSYTITAPFEINWRLAAPRDFRTLEYFLTPQISFVFREITNGKLPFNIGAYLMQNPDKEVQFLREVLPQRSQERIDTAFKQEDISAFFTFEEAETLAKLFADEGFICRKLEINYMGRPVDITELDQNDAHKVIKECARLKVIRAFEFSEKGDLYQEMYDDTFEGLERKFIREKNEREWNKRGTTKKRLIMKTVIGSAFLAASTVCIALSRRLFAGKGWKTFLGGMACAVAAVVTGVIGRRFTEETVEHLRKGAMAAYV